MAGGIGVRDSKNPAGPRLIFTRQAWADFVEGVKRWPAGTAPQAGRPEQESS
jgi:hypothetical protein